ncbi:hypothetical protein J0S82_002208 [Galemys pyrenaicus]|uniref:Uncharacterized protein n=1 Tax=Galemys pyrenaicus TaxID=202257 RepID=A0A8J5ZT40_GALPY|nr:hypothetical protein J0S82_002208 [Galemys pyrenaicus]
MGLVCSTALCQQVPLPPACGPRSEPSVVSSCPVGLGGPGPRGPVRAGPSRASGQSGARWVWGWASCSCCGAGRRLSRDRSAQVTAREDTWASSRPALTALWAEPGVTPVWAGVAPKACRAGVVPGGLARVGRAWAAAARHLAPSAGRWVCTSAALPAAGPGRAGGLKAPPAVRPPDERRARGRPRLPPPQPLPAAEPGPAVPRGACLPPRARSRGQGSGVSAATSTAPGRAVVSPSQSALQPELQPLQTTRPSAQDGASACGGLRASASGSLATPGLRLPGSAGSWAAGWSRWPRAGWCGPGSALLVHESLLLARRGLPWLLPWLLGRTQARTALLVTGRGAPGPTGECPVWPAGRVPTHLTPPLAVLQTSPPR